MALTLTAAVAENAIRQVNLTWDGASGKAVTIYRSTSAIDISGDTIDWTGATKFENLTGGTKIDAGLDDGTYYYYVTDGTSTAASSPASVEIAQDSYGYAAEIQGDYVPTSIDKVTEADAWRNALNNSGRVTFNPIQIGYEASKNNIAIVAIVGGDVTEKSIAKKLAGLTNLKGFAILQTGAIQNFTGYQAKLSGSTQIQYVAVSNS